MPNYTVFWKNVTKLINILFSGNIKSAISLVSQKGGTVESTNCRITVESKILLVRFSAL